MIRRFFIGSGLTIMLLLSALSAQAALISHFLYEGQDRVGNNVTVAFFMPASPTPTLFNPGNSFSLGVGFAPVAVNGLSGNAGFVFRTSSNTGGLDILFSVAGYTGDLVHGEGAQLFSGTVDAPTFVDGVYNLIQPVSAGTLTITTSDVVPRSDNIPEPASLALLGAGLIGLTASRRRRTR